LFCTLPVAVSSPQRGLAWVEFDNAGNEMCLAGRRPEQRETI
jgi:hypothetical protein